MSDKRECTCHDADWIYGVEPGEGYGEYRGWWCATCHGEDMPPMIHLGDKPEPEWHCDTNCPIHGNPQPEGDVSPRGMDNNIPHGHVCSWCFQRPHANDCPLVRIRELETEVERLKIEQSSAKEPMLEMPHVVSLRSDGILLYESNDDPMAVRYVRTGCTPTVTTYIAGATVHNVPCPTGLDTRLGVWFSPEAWASVVGMEAEVEELRAMNTQKATMIEEMAAATFNNEREYLRAEVKRARNGCKRLVEDKDEQFRMMLTNIQNVEAERDALQAKLERAKEVLQCALYETVNASTYPDGPNLDRSTREEIAAVLKEIEP